jgi:hypothetical protein
VRFSLILFDCACSPHLSPAAEAKFLVPGWGMKLTLHCKETVQKI